MVEGGDRLLATSLSGDAMTCASSGQKTPGDVGERFQVRDFVCFLCTDRNSEQKSSGIPSLGPITPKKRNRKGMMNLKLPN